MLRCSLNRLSNCELIVARERSPAAIRRRGSTLPPVSRITDGAPVGRDLARQRRGQRRRAARFDHQLQLGEREALRRAHLGVGDRHPSVAQRSCSTAKLIGLVAGRLQRIAGGRRGVGGDALDLAGCEAAARRRPSLPARPARSRRRGRRGRARRSARRRRSGRRSASAVRPRAPAARRSRSRRCPGPRSPTDRRRRGPASRRAPRTSRAATASRSSRGRS